MRTSPLIPVCVALATVCAGSVASPAAANASKPNILVILSDDYGYGSAGCYGADPSLVRTPNLDRLAREGRRFTDANTPSSVCTPTRYALVMFYEDRPGMVGKFGSILGENGINIASMSVGRRKKRGQAVVILSLDDTVNDAVAAEIAKATETNDVYPVMLTSVPE